jgi:hypothetical protein
MKRVVVLRNHALGGSVAPNTIQQNSERPASSGLGLSLRYRYRLPADRYSPTLAAAFSRNKARIPNIPSHHRAGSVSCLRHDAPLASAGDSQPKSPGRPGGSDRSRRPSRAPATTGIATDMEDYTGQSCSLRMGSYAGGQKAVFFFVRN